MVPDILALQGSSLSQSDQTLGKQSPRRKRRDSSVTERAEKIINVELSTNDIRDNFSDIIDKIFFKGENVVLTRRGKHLAFFVQANDYLLSLPKEEQSVSDVRDGLSDLVGRVFYTNAVIAIKKNGKLRAMMISRQTLNESLSKQTDDDSVAWESLDDRPSKPPADGSKVRHRMGKSPGP